MHNLGVAAMALHPSNLSKAYAFALLAWQPCNLDIFTDLSILDAQSWPGDVDLAAFQSQ